METNSYKRVILPQAESDIDAALNYISKDLCNPDAAIKLLNDMQQMMERISSFPYSFPKLNAQELTLGKEYRRADVNNFVLIYRIAEDVKEVRVMAALYAPSEIMLQLLSRM